MAERRAPDACDEDADATDGRDVFGERVHDRVDGQDLIGAPAGRATQELFRKIGVGVAVVADPQLPQRGAGRKRGEGACCFRPFEQRREDLRAAIRGALRVDDLPGLGSQRVVHRRGEIESDARLRERRGVLRLKRRVLRRCRRAGSGRRRGHGLVRGLVRAAAGRKQRGEKNDERGGKPARHGRAVIEATARAIASATLSL